jgi:hypothetical protein
MLSAMSVLLEQEKDPHILPDSKIRATTENWKKYQLDWIWDLWVIRMRANTSKGTHSGIGRQF